MRHGSHQSSKQQQPAAAAANKRQCSSTRKSVPLQRAIQAWQHALQHLGSHALEATAAAADVLQFAAGAGSCSDSGSSNARLNSLGRCSVIGGICRCMWLHGGNCQQLGHRALLPAALCTVAVAKWL
eukprot:GHRR01001828.1.p3 GENE.GHRR01001828.1~~GHRR01001828.1.p3  ORF type:complete len:127 (+),score=74.03 GHRR01001828.1:686-1066(+)